MRSPLLILAKVFILLSGCTAASYNDYNPNSYAFNDQEQLESGSFESERNEQVIRHESPTTSSWSDQHRSPSSSSLIPRGPVAGAYEFVSEVDRVGSSASELQASRLRSRRRLPDNDNAAPSSGADELVSKSNPLIERALEGEDSEDGGSALDTLANREALKASFDNAGSNTSQDFYEQPRLYGNGRNIRPSLRVGFENHEGKSRSRNRNDWCQRDCTITSDNNNINGRPMPSKHHHQVCGSDGRFYGSMCELRRHACRHDIYLYRRSKRHCLTSMHKSSTSEAAIADAPKAPDQNNRSGLSNHSVEVRIVDLKRRCRRTEYDEMKLLLLREFDGDIESMFRYFDSNDDDSIEAHELWPKRESNKFLYAQTWDRHSVNCGEDVLKSHHQLHMDGGSLSDKKCWFFLDFAFEPHISTNPCSLSHLMLFDLKHPNNKFDLSTFELAFKDMEERLATNPQVNSKDWAPQTKLTQLTVALGDSLDLRCSLNLSDFDAPDSIDDNIIDINEEDNIRCYWSRYNTDLMTVQDAHVSIRKESTYSKSSPISRLHIEDAQLYLSGQFKCACHSKKYGRTFDHLFSVQVIANPHVEVKPRSQWSLPNSRISFECHYDYIDTSSKSTKSSHCQDNLTTQQTEDFEGLISEKGQYGLKIKWLKDNQEFIVDSKNFNDTKTRAEKHDVADLSQRTSITMTASRLTVEHLNISDTGRYTCRVDLPTNRCVAPRDSNEQLSTKSDSTFGQNNGSLLVQDRPLNNAESFDGLRLTSVDQSEAANTNVRHLWMFHDNGISIYRLTSDDGQEMELLREINGHSLVSAEVDGNWNQLTLCGGLNSEQVVICEWSDNALHIDIGFEGTPKIHEGDDVKSILTGRSYIYVGQPNLNRVIVMDGSRFEIMAIINTEPQPRKLYLYKPSKIHLTKWVRRKLSPAANARWLSAIGKHAHSLKFTPRSNLYSEKPRDFHHHHHHHHHQPTPMWRRHRDRRAEEQHQSFSPKPNPSRSFSELHAQEATTNQPPSTLIQHDIWLLCYGQPLVLDPAGEENLEEVGRFHAAFSGEALAQTTQSSGNASNLRTVNRGDGNLSQTTMTKQTPIVQPFTPLLSAGPQFAWSVWLNKEAKLRNRKSVHIIQSTFFPQPASAHSHAYDEETESTPDYIERRRRRSSNLSVVGEFKKSTVLTTHHIFSGIQSVSKVQQMYLDRAGGQFDLIQDLYVSPKPYSMKNNNHYKVHHAFVTHYDDRRLFRVSMDEYRYDREIDLQNCDPIKMITTAQGLLVIQCRAPITHNLIGQMVLDQLTSSRIEFNANIRAQESYLSPDHRYLVSIYTNSTQTQTRTTTSAVTINDTNSADNAKKKAINEEERRQSIVYVQLVSVEGLKLQYEIKTQLEISQCSFVWKDGYYAAIFVSTNRRDGQSEILSLRLADSRLELMARVPGLISATRHKEQLIVSPELRLAALSTNQGTYVVDLEENRVLQSLRHHRSPPTLLWV